MRERERERQRTLFFVIIIIILILMMKLIALLLLGLVSLVEGEVVDSFADSCPEFFIKDQNNRPVTPTVLVSQKRDKTGKLIERYRQICQKYKGRYRYATLYDIRNRIPVYSAYLYTGYAKVKPKSTWMIEPGVGLLCFLSVV